MEKSQILLTEDTFSLMKTHEPNPWGIVSAQKRDPKERVVANAGWYNGRGEYVGFGDLSASDLVKLAQVLQVGEVFVVLSENDSFRNFVKGTDAYYAAFCGGGVPIVPLNWQKPGFEYLKERCILIVVCGSVSVVEDKVRGLSASLERNLALTMISREECRKEFERIELTLLA